MFPEELEDRGRDMVKFRRLEHRARPDHVILRPALQLLEDAELHKFREGDLAGLPCRFVGPAIWPAGNGKFVKPFVVEAETRLSLCLIIGDMATCERNAQMSLEKKH